MIRNTWITVTCLVVVQAGCGPSDPSSEVAVRVDSLGVDLVHNTAVDRPLSLTFSRHFDLGGESSGPESFYRVFPPQLSINQRGVIAVLNQAEKTVSVFGPEGAARVSFGREGKGPGDLSFPSSLSVTPQDEILVFDARKRAFLRFGSDGSFLDATASRITFGGGPIYAATNGVWLASRERSPGTGVVLRRLLLVTAQDTIAVGESVTINVASVFYESCGMSLSLAPLFDADLVWATNGRRTAAVTGADYSIALYDGTELVAVVRRDLSPEVATEAVAKRVIGEGSTWNVGGRDCLVPADEVLEKRGYASVLPLVEGLAIALSGALWVRRREPGSEKRVPKT